MKYREGVTLRKLFIICCVLMATVSINDANVVIADNHTSTINELRSKIGDRNTQIEELEKEIEGYKVELEVVGKEKSSLKKAIKTLDISQNKLETNIRITQNRVSSTNLQIDSLTLKIVDKENKIELHSSTLAKSLREIDEIENNTFIETLLSYDSLSQLWEQMESLQRFQEEIKQNLNKLKILKVESEDSKLEQEEKRRELVNYKYELSNQKEVVKINKNEKNKLLKQTQNKESNYKTLLDEKIEARIAFEQELLELESQLQIAIDPDSIPQAQKGILAWPLDTITVTQYFGNTRFAQSGAYNGSGHNGIDFRAAPGTRVTSVLNGTVTETGNTDTVPGCFSYGKWVLVKHNNGLSSLYSHLSHISVEKGGQVFTGQVIGYSGNTGYSTGPHLHMGLFASQGVQVVRLGDIKKITNCSDARVPIAPLQAYLNPLAYLPE